MLEQLNRALDHIESHLDHEIDAAELARIAMTSEYHLRRVFSALAGMPLSEYIRRRRLTLAAAEVLADERTLLEVAVRHGYSSGEAFARAFRAMHGVGPGEARRTGAVLSSQPRMSFRLVIEGSSSMRYRIVHKNAFHVVGKKARVPLVHEGVNPAIAAFVQGIDRETTDRIKTLSDQDPDGIVAVTDDLDPGRAEGTELDYWHGVVTSTRIPNDNRDNREDRNDHHDTHDLDTLAVPPGTWAVFENTGPYPQALQYLWRDIFTEWFPANPYRSRPGPEILRVRPFEDENGTQAHAALWIPVEPTTS
ncbi:AraC family transcriptional regulator [Embleya sp. NPDC005971]|uniref:AraC family transcriptional regulator n=1 Tax=unclassified Embleya TaxID=2699296 RepID=UPI0033D0274C